MFFLIALTATITQLVTFIISEIATPKKHLPKSSNKHSRKIEYKNSSKEDIDDNQYELVLK